MSKRDVVVTTAVIIEVLKRLLYWSVFGIGVFVIAKWILLRLWVIFVLAYVCRQGC